MLGSRVVPAVGPGVIGARVTGAEVSTGVGRDTGLSIGFVERVSERLVGCSLVASFGLFEGFPEGKADLLGDTLAAKLGFPLEDSDGAEDERAEGDSIGDEAGDEAGEPGARPGAALIGARPGAALIGARPGAALIGARP